MFSIFFSVLLFLSQTLVPSTLATKALFVSRYQDNRRRCVHANNARLRMMNTIWCAVMIGIRTRANVILERKLAKKRNQSKCLNAVSLVVCVFHLRLGFHLL